MDGLSSAVTIGTVLDLSAKLLSASRQYYKEVKGAKKEIKSIINELSNLQEVLKRIEKLGDSLPLSQLAALDHLWKPDGPLHQCHGLLGPLVSKLDKPLTSRRIMVWPLKKSDVESTLEEIERLKATLTLALSTAQTELQSSSDSKLLNISDDAERQKNEKLRIDVIAWLSTTRPSSNHNINRRKHQPGTGEWFLSGYYFREWRTAPNSILWLHGSAGCGKSILSSTIIDHIQANHAVRTKSPLVYYYFDFNDSMKQKVANFMSSILADLCAQTNDLPDPVQQLYLKCNDGHREPLLSDLVSVFLAAVPLFDAVFVVIDALDECPTKDDERQELLKTIKAIHDQSAMNLHLLVTSRRHYDIETVIGALTGVEAIQIESTVNDDDIKMYIRSEVQTIRKNNTWWHDSLCTAVEETLVEGANGMFRWVYCQLDALKSCLRATAVEEKLKKLPKDLRTTYAQILADLPEDYLEDARIALRWLVFSERPLFLEELVEALRIDPSRRPPVDTNARLANPNQILEILPNLITIFSVDHERAQWEFEWRYSGYHNGTIRDLVIKLAHFSVEEFLLSGMTEKCETAPLLASTKLNQCFMTEACLYYILSYEESKQKARSVKDLMSFPLLAYACRHWPDHRAIFIEHEQSSNQMEPPSAMENTLLRLFTLSDERLAWPQVYRPDKPHESAFTESEEYPPATALYLAAYHGLYGIAKQLLDSGQDIEQQGGYLGTPLLVACYSKNLDVARLFLDNGANIDAKTADGDGALHILAMDRHIEIVRFFLEHGATADIENSSKITPLAHAARRGHCKIIEALLDHGANIEQLAQDGLTPLISAVYALQFSAVNVLLDRGANIDQIGRRAVLASGLHICAFFGVERDFPGMATLLLDRGANVNLSDRQGLTPLAIAVKRQKPEMVRLFLDRGADVFVRDKKGRTVLKIARRQRRRLEEDDNSEWIEKYDQIILKIKEAEKVWQQEHGGSVDQEGSPDSDTESPDTEDDEYDKFVSSWKGHRYAARLRLLS